MVVCLSPPHHGAPETEERNTYTHARAHTLFQPPRRRTAWLCVTPKNPTFPSIRQTGRQLGVTLNPFPHVSLPNKGSALTVTSLFLLLSLFHASRSKRREKAVSFGEVCNYDMIVKMRSGFMNSLEEVLRFKTAGLARREQPLREAGNET